MKHELQTAIVHDGLTYRAVSLRKLTSKDVQYVNSQVAKRLKETGQQPKNIDAFVLMVTRLSDLPPEVVRKFSLRDMQAVSASISEMYGIGK